MRKLASDDGPGSGKLLFTLEQEKAMAEAVQDFQRVKQSSEIIDYKVYFLQAVKDLCLNPPHGPGDTDLVEWGVGRDGHDTFIEPGLKKYEALAIHLEAEWLSPRWLRVFSSVHRLRYLADAYF